ncbi:MAG: single-stranded-DNA-specific exonuclease RecJ [Patescibacteria group bacterium]
MKWQVKTKAPDAFFKQFPEFSPLIAQLLYNRGLRTQPQIDEFFNLDYQTDIHNPFLLKGMKRAVKRIAQAIKRQEKIAVYGDFDADGVCATAIVSLTLQKLGAQKIDIYIPDREKENHGLNNNSIQQLAQAGTNLIITVDCASTDLEEVKLANSLGLDVIITDHHELKKNLPPAVALINPRQKNDRYPFKSLAGAGIAYKLACALLSSKAGNLDKVQREAFKKWLLDLTALATVADVEPLIGENRTLVKYGLGVLAQTKWLGLKKLMEIARISPEITQSSLNGEAPLTNLDSYTLAFILGPRLNAAGRMKHADIAYGLLVSQNESQAEELAQKINQSNLSRRNVTERVFKEAETRLINKFNQGENPKLIFEGSPDWPVGVNGLVASKLSDKYNRPAVIYQEKGDLIRASCRSPHYFDLMTLFNQSAEYFDDYGGRKGTGGFQMNKKNLAKARESFIKTAEEKLKDLDIEPILEIDAELSLGDINWQNYDQIELFAPFGRANPKPVFLIKGVEIADSRMVGNNSQHLKMELLLFDKDSDIPKNFKAIAFGLGERESLLKKGSSVNVIFELIANQWNGQRDLEMKVKEIRLAD